jgi:hypothetical protein
VFFKALGFIAWQIAYFQLLDPKRSHPYGEYFGGRYADVERGAAAGGSSMPGGGGSSAFGGCIAGLASFERKEGDPAVAFFLRL